MLQMDGVRHSIYILCVEMCQFLQMNGMIDTRIYNIIIIIILNVLQNLYRVSVVR